MPSKPLTGRVPPDAIRLLSLPRLDPGLLRRYAALEDLSGAVSDALDQLGLQGAVPASALAPTLPDRRLVGQAVTVRNVPRADSVAAAAASGKGMMGEHEAYNLAEPGDVVVIEGLPGVSNLGGQSAAVASRSGCAGAIVDGGHRDPDASRELGFPMVARPHAHHRQVAAAHYRDQRHGPYREYAGPGRRPVVADDAGVVFVPHAQALAVLEAAERVHAGDARQKADIARGVDLATLAATRYK
ncbi:hypothetical protein WJ970_20745 [Achromobacter xylosoxidans]